MSRRLLRYFNSVAEAEVAASFLRAQGFDAQLPDRQFLSANPEFGLSSGGYRIDVPTAEHYRATLLLAEVDGPPPRHGLGGPCRGRRTTTPPAPTGRRGARRGARPSARPRRRGPPR